MLINVHLFFICLAIFNGAAQSIQPSNNLIPSLIHDTLQACEVPCVTNFIQRVFRPFVCGQPPTLDCLCARYSNAGLALGDAVLQCHRASCLKNTSNPNNAIRDYCSGNFVSSSVTIVQPTSRPFTTTSLITSKLKDHSPSAAAYTAVMASQSLPLSAKISDSKTFKSTLPTVTSGPSPISSSTASNPVTANASSMPTRAPASRSLTGAQIAGIGIAAAATSIILLFVLGCIMVKIRKRKRLEAASPFSDSHFNIPEKQNATRTDKTGANFSRGGGSRDLNPFSTAYPKLRYDHEGWRPDPNQIGVAISPEDSSPESVESMHSATGLLPLPKPPSKNLRIAPQRFQPQRRRRDSEMTQFEEDMQGGLPEIQRRLSKPPKSPGGPRRSLSSALSLHANVSPRSSSWRRPSPPKLLIPNDSRSSLKPPSRPLRPPSDNSIYIEPLAPTKPSFQVARSLQKPATTSPQQLLHPPDRPTDTCAHTPTKLPIVLDPSGLLVPPAQSSPAISTYSNLPSASRDYIPSYYYNPPMSANKDSIPPPPPVPLVPTAPPPKPLPPLHQEPSVTPRLPKSGPAKPPLRESAASDTSFESLCSEMTPPDETGPTSPSLTAKTPVTPPHQNGTPLTPIDEGPASPVANLRYPKVPRASNQAVPRPSPPQPGFTVVFPAEASGSRHTRDASLLEKRRGQNTAHDLEKGLWITGSNVKTVPSQPLAPSRHADGTMLTSPPGPQPPPKSHHAQHHTHVARPPDAFISPSSPPYPLRSTSRTSHSSAPQQYKPPGARASKASKTSSYNSRGSSPTLPPPTPRSPPSTPDRTQARLLKARQLAQNTHAPRNAVGLVMGEAGGQSDAKVQPLKIRNRSVDELVMKSPLWDPNPRLTPRRQGNGDMIIDVSPR